MIVLSLVYGHFRNSNNYHFNESIFMLHVEFRKYHDALPAHLMPIYPHKLLQVAGQGLVVFGQNLRVQTP